MGVHSPEEVSQFGCTDLKVLSDTLADKPFFFGDEPTTVSIINPLIRIANFAAVMHILAVYFASRVNDSFGYLQPDTNKDRWINASCGRMVIALDFAKKLRCLFH